MTEDQAMQHTQQFLTVAMGEAQPDDNRRVALELWLRNKLLLAYQSGCYDGYTQAAEVATRKR